MASELPENVEQFEDAAWGEEGDGYESANEIQHSDQEHQDSDFAHDQASSNGDQAQEGGEQVEQEEEGEQATEPGPEHEQQQEQEQEQGQGASAAESPALDDQEEEEDGGEGEYDPESVSITPVPQISQQPPPPAPGASVKPKAAKPKKSGGFLVGDSDDEEDAPTSSTTPLAAGNAQTPDVPQPSASLNVSPPTQDPAGVPPAADHGDSVVPPSAAVQGASLTQARNPSDRLGHLESRVQEDPRGEMDAWLDLMAEHRRLDQLDQLRQVYDRFLSVFPQAAEIWVQWIRLELDCMNTTAAETLFQRSLLNVSNVQLWATYINYIRRRNDLTNDPNGQARQVISQSYEFVMDNVGMDRESGQLWKDWIQFIKSGPGQVGGPGWQDQQKMDQLRKAFHRAITVPMTTVSELWKDYDQFELSLNKATGRQFIQKRSPGYMTAKSAGLQLERKIAKLRRTTLPRLPPMPGFAGDQDFTEQVDIWKQWIQWEKEDPLVLKDDEPEAYKGRILYVYRQALLALRFWPEMWVDAAEWCFANNIFKDGNDLGLKFLSDGIEANPESVLLAFKQGDRIEMTHPAGDADESKQARADAVRKPYDNVLDTLYKMMQNLKGREKKDVAQAEQAAAAAAASAQDPDEPNYDDDSDEMPKKTGGEEMLNAVKQSFASQTDLLKRTISFVWIALCRAMRRAQGKGSPTAGLRKVFTEARHRGQITSDVYVAVASIEHVVYKDPAGGKIFDRGAKLFPEDETFMLEYIKFLHSKDDTTNARVAFETCVNRLAQNPDKKHKARSLYLYFHKYESQYGELSPISILEKRMAELWPEDPKLLHFSNRHSVDSFDPIAYRLIISPSVQLRPKILPSIELPTSVRNSPAPAVPAPPPPMRQTASPGPQYLGTTTHSPKRTHPGDDQEELSRPRKYARGESPLKGAAGRRLDQSRRNNAGPLSRDITFILGILPPAQAYDAHHFNASRLVGLVQNTHVPDFGAWRSSQDQSLRQNNNAPPPRGAPQHGRQPSAGEYPPYGGRESPNPRPLSPYDGGGHGGGQRVTSQTGYRNSPLRPEGAYEPPLPLGGGYRQDGPPAYGQQQPPQQWPVPPPPGGYGAPPPQQQFGQYQY